MFLVHPTAFVSPSDYSVVALDMRGYNDSEKPQGVSKYTSQILAKDVAEAIEKLGKQLQRVRQTSTFQEGRRSSSPMIGEQLSRGSWRHSALTWCSDSSS